MQKKHLTRDFLWPPFDSFNKFELIGFLLVRSEEAAGGGSAVEKDDKGGWSDGVKKCMQLKPSEE